MEDFPLGKFDFQNGKIREIWAAYKSCAYLIRRLLFQKYYFAFSSSIYQPIRPFVLSTRHPLSPNAHVLWAWWTSSTGTEVAWKWERKRDGQVSPRRVVDSSADGKAKFFFYPRSGGRVLSIGQSIKFLKLLQLFKLFELLRV